MVFGMPLFFLAMTLFIGFKLENEPKKKNMSTVMKSLTLWLCPVLGLVMIPMSMLISMGHDLPITGIVLLFVGALFAVCGNYLPKSKQNFSMGIRTAWTLNSTENWNRTHRFGGKVWLSGGLIMIVVAIANFGGTAPWLGRVTLGALLVCSFLPVGYSYLLFKKGI